MKTIVIDDKAPVKIRAHYKTNEDMAVNVEILMAPEAIADEAGMKFAFDTLRKQAQKVIDKANADRRASNIE